VNKEERPKWIKRRRIEREGNTWLAGLVQESNDGLEARLAENIALWNKLAPKAQQPPCVDPVTSSLTPAVRE
jgi:hypothetical protein